MELISIWYLSSLKQFVCSERASEVSVVLQRRFRWVFPGPFSLGSCTVNCTTQTEGILRGKAAFNSLMSCRSVSFEFSFWEGKTRFTHANAVNKRANSHNFKRKNFEFLYNYFPCHSLTEQRLIFVHQLTVDESE